jgi:HK97 family phage major capsid protein
MQSIQALREQRNIAATAMRKLVDDTPADKWGTDEQTKFDAGMADVEKIDAQIARVQKVVDLNGATKDAIDGLADFTGKNLGHTKAEEEKRVGIYTKFLRGGDKGMTSDELLAMSKLRNAQSEGTNTAGGYLVPVTTVAQLLVEMKAYGGMRSVADIIQTMSGENMQWPTMDDTGNTGELVAENQAAASQDLTFGQASLQPYKFSSKVFAVSFELMQDSLIDVIGIVNAAAAERIGRSQNTYFTTGTGTSQPKGAVVAAASGTTGATGQTLSIISDDLVNLEHSVDPAYRNQGTCKWMFHDLTLKVLKKLKDGQNRPLWLPGLAGIAGPLAQDTLMNYGYTINQDMPVMAANAKSVLFGTFKRYMIRDVMQMLLFRFDDSTYIKNGQIGFLMWARAGGNYVASSNSSLKYYANSAT